MSNNSTSLKNSILATAAFAILIWCLKLCEAVFGWQLYQLGVLPQTGSGLAGIITGPVIHGSWQHVAGNTPPLLLLGSILVYGYPKSRWWTLAIIWLVSGFGVWLFGRDSYHYGASGLTHGIFFYLFVAGILRRDKRSTTLLMVAFFMYCGMLMTIFPGNPGVSWEYHLSGAIAGSICAIVFRHLDPKLKDKTYSWEQQSSDTDAPSEEEDPVIGDQWMLENGKDEKNRTTWPPSE